MYVLFYIIYAFLPIMYVCMYAGHVLMLILIIKHRTMSLDLARHFANRQTITHRYSLHALWLPWNRLNVKQTYICSAGNVRITTRGVLRG